MKKALLLLLLLNTLSVFGQNSSLKIRYEIYDENCNFSILVKNEKDTVYNSKIESYDENSIKIKNLAMGQYTIEVIDLKSKIVYYSKNVTLNNLLETIVNITITFYEQESLIDSLTQEEIGDNKSENVFSISYMPQNKIYPNSIFTNSYSIGYTYFGWLPVTKHLGLMGGGGFNASQYYLKKDTSYFITPEYKKIYENYTYLDAHLDLKLRISSGNQQNTKTNSSKLFIDIGAVYNFPLYFKDIARYEDGYRLLKSYIHQHTDARVYVNIGYSPVMFFAEYRLFNFISGNFAEIDKFRAGMRISFDYTNYSNKYPSE